MITLVLISLFIGSIALSIDLFKNSDGYSILLASQEVIDSVFYAYTYIYLALFIIMFSVNIDLLI